ncbi:MAG: GAF domain-containing protein [Nocardiopsaceae bacterium]|jgi:signal transduction histidine kinase|nr:GAF domain-containing protein [Nocardiopsaceae bacterium]
MGVSGSRPTDPRLRPGDLPGELQDRLRAALATRDQVYAVLAAVAAGGQGLDLAALLHQIVAAAVTLGRARYGAVAAPGEGGPLAEFVPAGLDEAGTARAGRWPEQQGVLGRLVTDPRPIRLAGAGEQPAPAGAPAGQPAIRPFLGVPLRVAGEVYGGLYLTGKLDGGEFDEGDEALLAALAAAAGVAIDNARLQEETRRQQRWLRASGEITRHLLSGITPGAVLDLVTAQVLEMSGADLVAVAVPAPDGQRLLIAHAAGEGAESARGLVFPAAESLSGQVLATGEPVTVGDFSTDERVNPLVREQVPLGPAILAPLGTPGDVRGVFTVGRRRGSDPLPGRVAEMVGTFAVQAAIALELAEHREDAERLAVLQDRDRIARDLHDLVIQRLYATGMSLQGTLPLVPRSDVADRMSAAVDSLDETIKEIRSAIFALQSSTAAKPPGLRAKILAAVAEMTTPLGFAPSLRLVGPLDERVTGDAGEQLLGALREALANAARHAAASRVEVTVEAGDEVVLRVRDDGRGMGAGTRRGGLAGLSERAGRLGGRVQVSEPAYGGTEIEWRVPALAARPRRPAPQP